MKKWTFKTCAFTAFGLGALGMLLLVVNLVTGFELTAVLVPLAIVAWACGGALSGRSHVLWLRS